MKIRQLVTLAVAAVATLSFSACAAEAPVGPSACTSEQLPLKIGVPDDSTETTYDFEFGPATEACTLIEPLHVAYLDTDQSVIGAAAAYTGEEFQAQDVAAGDFLNVAIDFRTGDDLPTDSCDPAESTYIGWKFPGDDGYGTADGVSSLGEQPGGGRMACASPDQELLEVGPYRIQ